MSLATFQIGEYDLALKRDQAAAAMLFLSGMRATAFATLPIEAVDLGEKTIKQWLELVVQTKNGKREKTNLLPIPELMNVVEEWDSRVRNLLDSSAR
jgi:integrase